jgi:GNAT superfamily N-acetyltransferase
MNSLELRRLTSDPTANQETWAAVREICCKTGDNGRPIAADRWEFFSKLWIDPYEKLLPEWTYVVVAGEGVVGYLTGCPDSGKFFRRKRWRVDLPLLGRIILGQYRGVQGARQFTLGALGLRKKAERLVSRRTRSILKRNFPAHLHVNVHEAFRGAGAGRRLIERYLDDLQVHGVTGVHLLCGTGPVGFYQRLGFQVLESIVISRAEIFILGRRL